MHSNRIIRSLSTRKLISPNETKVSYTQIFGFIFIVLGIVIITIAGFCNLSSSIIAISFFITMLGIAFAFPSLLEAKDGLSTMRIVVFMMVNVISMLLIKIGWNKCSLTDIGLDQWWMGVIAFVFGAKATQSYFESKLAALKSDDSKVGTAAINFTNSDIAKLAVEQNQQYLRIKFPNIVSISDTVNDLNQKETHLVAIYLNDSNDVGIPGKLEARMPDGSIKTVSTEIVKDLGKSKIHFSQIDSFVSNTYSPDYLGSICCAVSSNTDSNFKGIITAAHVLTDGRYDDSNNGILNPSQQSKIILDGKNSGIWFYKLLTYDQDLAIIKLNSNKTPSTNYLCFKNQFYTITDKDVKLTNPNVTIVSKNKKKDAYIINYGIGLSLYYSNGEFYKNNIILIGSSNDPNNSKSISEPGDSGGCVFIKDSMQLIGILLGGDNKFSYVLPIADALISNNFQTM
jgi:hypothetical protein